MSGAKLFHSRFKSHEETARHHVEERRPRKPNLNISRPSCASEPLADRPYVYIGVRLRARGDVSEGME
jgi:hypothetical protein